MSISIRAEGEPSREGDAAPSFVRTTLCFLLVFATHLFHQEAFLSVNAAEGACFPYRLAGAMVRKNGMTPYLVESHSLVKGGGGLEKNDGPRQDVLLQNRTPEPMDASKHVCPNAACSARGKLGAGKSSIHGRNRPRYRCHKSGQLAPVCFGKSLRPLVVS